jgi:hypothetical protein
MRNAKVCGISKPNALKELTLRRYTFTAIPLGAWSMSKKTGA